MSYISLYRKYRPSTFDEVIGQDHIVRILTNQIVNGNVAHAYLFCGTRGTGKTSVARIFAKAVNCTNPVSGSPCQKCKQCMELSQPNNMDIIEIDAASNNSIDDIRDIRDSVKYPPINAKYKVYIIDEVHQLSGAAFNGLLKTLEEPPSHTIFILATTEAHKILQTILSRCIKLDFRLVALNILANHIKKIFDNEKVLYEEEAILAIARAGEGSVRDTISVADMCMSYNEDKITYESVIEVLGANNPLLIVDIAKSILAGELSKSLQVIDTTAALGKSITVLARDITKFLRDLLIIKQVSNNELVQLPDKVYSAAEELAKEFSKTTILRALEILSSIDMNMKYSTFPKILLESAIGRIATFEGSDNIDILAKVDSLEKRVKEFETNYPNQQAPQRQAQCEAANSTKSPLDMSNTPIKGIKNIVKQTTKSNANTATNTAKIDIQQSDKKPGTAESVDKNINNNSAVTNSAINNQTTIDNNIDNNTDNNIDNNNEDNPQVKDVVIQDIGDSNNTVILTNNNINNVQENGTKYFEKIDNNNIDIDTEKTQVSPKVDVDNQHQEYTKQDNSNNNTDSSINNYSNVDDTISKDNLQKAEDLQEVEDMGLVYSEDAFLSVEEKEALRIRGILLNALRNKNAMILSKIISDETSTIIDISDNTINIRITRESEYKYADRKKDLIIQCIKESIREDYSLNIEHYNISTEEGYLKEITNFFGKENINIKNK